MTTYKFNEGLYPRILLRKYFEKHICRKGYKRSGNLFQGFQCFVTGYERFIGLDLESL